MKSIFLSLFAVLCFAFSSQAQTEINPDVQWKFVRTNDVQLLTGQLQTFEFPAYKNLDYIVNLEIKSDTVDLELYLYDMQSQLLTELSAKKTSAGQLEFSVKYNATYQVAVRVKSLNEGEVKPVDVLMSLLKRPKI
jgi:hypothetical protein